MNGYGRPWTAFFINNVIKRGPSKLVCRWPSVNILSNKMTAMMQIMSTISYIVKTPLIPLKVAKNDTFSGISAKLFKI